MSKWIDYEALKEHIEVVSYEGMWHTTETDLFVSVDNINNAPSIDLVRCGECKWLRYCETEDLDMYLDCDKPDGGGIPKSEGWYCADGERRESE